MEHIEQAGVHSGDSACSLPPYSLPKHIQDDIRGQVGRMARGLMLSTNECADGCSGRDVYVMK